MKTPRTPTLPAALVVAALALVPVHSASAQPAAPATGVVEGAPLEWPARATSMVRELEVGPWQLEWVSMFGPPQAESDRADAAAIAEQIGCDAAAVKFEGPGSVLVRMPQGELTRTARAAGKPAAAYEYISADARPDGRWQMQRTWFALYEPRTKDAQSSEGRGLVVLLPGMFGTPEPVIDSMVGMLRQRGWHVLRMLTHSSRFTEQAMFMLDPAGDLEAQARAAAAEFGDRAAECAMSVDAVCAEIGSSRPGVPVGRRVGLGMSGGGMILSTVIAHDRDAYDSAVFIGAGCDFAQIAMDSNYTDWINAVRVSWPEGGRTPAAEARFTDAYRGAATFDSYSTAPRLAGLPMLMVQGTVDLAVPTAMGDLLWERLGEPERWSEALGHETLFLVYLPMKAGKVLDWIDDHTSQ
ncbi:MAG: alpha/beta hydrolase [Phycisphaerales bacterium]|nr:alpha/beta hydrolase [Phycisphaerales bacterium]